MTSTSAPLRVAVLGGGFGALETAFYLRWRAHHRVELTLISDTDEFLFKPNTIYVPFGKDPSSLSFPITPALDRRGIRFVHRQATEIDPDARIVHAGDHATPYDRLVIATGASMRPAEVPGMSEHAHTIWTVPEMLRLRETLDQVVEDAIDGRHRTITFVVPRGNRCSGPLYEIVMMLETWLRWHHVRERVSLRWVTYEEHFIQAFGPRLDELVLTEFRDRDIEHHRGLDVDHVERDAVVTRDGSRFDTDVTITFPPYVAAQEYLGLGADDRGFLPVGNEKTRQLYGFDDIHVVGDAANFPVKQAFLAFLQADATAEYLAAEALGDTPKFDFDPVSMCVMEQFDHATFAQVPLELTGDPDLPVRVREADADSYRVGTGHTWRLGKKLLGAYLPWRFQRGLPFHAGIPWKGMDAGLFAMSHTLARK